MTFGIESSNIVGYTTKEAAQGKFIMLGAQFDQVTGGNYVNGLIAGVSGVDYDETEAFTKTAPQVQIPTALGYTTLFYLNDGYYETETGAEAYKAGWCDSSGNISDAELTPGVAIWFKSVGEDAVVNVAGAVPESDTADVACPTAFALRANVYPMSVKVNSDQMTSKDIQGVDYDESEAFTKTAPQIQIPTALGYTTLFYLNDGYYETETGAEAYKAGWCDSSGNIVDVAIPAAQGFWTKGVTAGFTLTFTK